MIYVYSIDNFGRKTLVYAGTSRQQAGVTVKNETAILDPDTNRYILVTSKEIPTYNTKGLNEECKVVHT